MKTVTFDETQWKLVPIQPTEDQWGGLARTIMMAWDFNQKTPYELFDFLSRSGHKIPPWMMQENEMRNRDHIPSKGTRATLIYRAFLEAAPTPPAVEQPSAQNREDSEHDCAIKEDMRNAACDNYFPARGHLDYNVKAAVFNAGFDRGWDAAIDAARTSKEPNHD